MIDLHFRQGLAHDKVREMRELILQRYDKNFDGRLEINEVCVKTAFGFQSSLNLQTVQLKDHSGMHRMKPTRCFVLM